MIYTGKRLSINLTFCILLFFFSPFILNSSTTPYTLNLFRIEDKILSVFCMVSPGTDEFKSYIYMFDGNGKLISKKIVAGRYYVALLKDKKLLLFRKNNYSVYRVNPEGEINFEYTHYYRIPFLPESVQIEENGNMVFMSIIRNALLIAKFDKNIVKIKKMFIPLLPKNKHLSMIKIFPKQRLLVISDNSITYVYEIKDVEVKFLYKFSGVNDFELYPLNHNTLCLYSDSRGIFLGKFDISTGIFSELHKININNISFLGWFSRLGFVPLSSEKYAIFILFPWYLDFYIVENGKTKYIGVFPDTLEWKRIREVFRYLPMIGGFLFFVALLFVYINIKREKNSNRELISRRIAALMIDHFIISFFTALIVYIFPIALQYLDYFIFIVCFYFFIFEAILAKTPGKFLAGIKVVMKDTGKRCTFHAAFVRNIFRIVDSFPFPFYLVGLISILFSASFQRIGDKFADTIVVKDENRRRK